MVGEWNLTGDAGELYMKGKIQGGVFLKNGNDGTEYVMAGEKAIGIKRQRLLFLPDGNLPEQYGRLLSQGLSLPLLSEKQEEESSKEQED